MSSYLKKVKLRVLYLLYMYFVWNFKCECVYWYVGGRGGGRGVIEVWYICIYFMVRVKVMRFDYYSLKMNIMIFEFCVIIIIIGE